MGRGKSKMTTAFIIESVMTYAIFQQFGAGTATAFWACWMTIYAVGALGLLVYHAFNREEAYRER